MRNNLSICLICFISIIIGGRAYGLCVHAAEANLRSGPGTQYQKSWEVFKYMPFKKIAKKGQWYKVQDVDGDIHWIHKKLVTDKFDCAVVKVEKANVRTGPGTHYKYSGYSPALKYITFKVLKRKGRWVKVLDEYNDSGWIFRKLLWIQ